jgi:hypothetical protein
MNPIDKARTFPWWIWIGGINIFFIIYLILAKHFYHFPGNRYFNLASEMSIAAWWSGICLFIGALLAYESFSTKIDGKRISWLFLSILLFGLSCDEIGSFHERIGTPNFSDLFPYGILFAILCTYTLIIFFQRRETRKAAFFLLAGFLLYGSVAIQEVLESSLNWPYWLKGIRAGVEEGTELFATLLILIGIVSQRNHQKFIGTFSRVIPNPYHMKYLPLIFLVGLLIHSVISPYVTLLADIPRRGNPAVLYPSLVCFILSCASYWSFKYSSDDKRKVWLIIFAYFIFYSISAVQFPLGKPISFVRYYLAHITIVSFIYINMFDQINYKHIFYLFLFLGTLIYIYLTKDIKMKYIASGIMPYFIADIFIFYKYRNSVENISIPNVI